MYRPGHIGAALLLYAPIGLVLLLADLPGVAISGGAISFWLASLPDVDHRIPFVSHRGVTHTLLFALAVGLVLGVAGWLFAGAVDATTPIRLAMFGFAVGTVTMLSHLLADAITPMGIQPLWPVSGQQYTLSLTRADNTVANYLLLGGGVLAVGTVLAIGSVI